MLPTLTTQRINLPSQPTPLIGRDTEVAAVRDLLRQGNVRLVTLTGPGGVGKTRLALQVAAELLEDCTDGVYFVDLASISDPGLVAAAIAQTFDVWETADLALEASLIAYLWEKDLLLLLDNFEQVLAAAPLLAALLAHCPQLRVVVTSREVLHLRGEREVPVSPLALPDLRHLPPLERLSQYAAVELFIQRAVAASANFAVTNVNAPAVAEICQRLDGLPLAIELAAARIKHFPPEVLLKRLEHRLPLLTGGPRDLPACQQTLRSAIDWSYHLLDSAKQTLFLWLSVFVGGCTLEAAEAVCSATQRVTGGQPLTVLDGLAALVDQSLIGVDVGVGGEARFRMLETIREYGLDRLEMGGEAEPQRQRHADYYLTLAEAAEPLLHGAEQVSWLDRLDAEHDNLRAALTWSQNAPNRAELGVRLAAALWWFWNLRGHLSEGRAWLERALVRSTAGSATLRATALLRAGWLAGEQADTAGMMRLCEEALALFRALDDQHGIAWALSLLAGGVFDQGDHARGITLCEEALALFRALDDQQGIAWALYFLGNLKRAQGDHARAGALLEESLALHRARGDICQIGYTLEKLGLVVTAQGDYDRAVALLQESLALWRELGNRRGGAITTANLGLVAAAQGDYDRAVALLQESLALWREVGDKPGIATSLNRLGEIAREQGDYQRAAVLYHESLALRRAFGERSGIAAVLHNLGYLALHQRDSRRATALFAESLALYQERGGTSGIALCLAGLAGAAVVQGQAKRAARLFGAAEALFDAIDARLDSADRIERDRYVAETHAQLDAATFAAAWEAGRAMTLEQAIAEALKA